MGQFKHPSAVTMYGVVTKDEPVSTVEEYSCFNHRYVLSKIPGGTKQSMQ